MTDVNTENSDANVNDVQINSTDPAEDMDAEDDLILENDSAELEAEDQDTTDGQIDNGEAVDGSEEIEENGEELTA